MFALFFVRCRVVESPYELLLLIPKRLISFPSRQGSEYDSGGGKAEAKLTRSWHSPPRTITRYALASPLLSTDHLISTDQSTTYAVKQV